MKVPLDGRRVASLRIRLLGHSPVRVNARPDFLIIGAQKAGTSSLYSWLTSHPDVLAARAKELHHFDKVQQSAPIRPYWANFPLEVGMKILRRIRRRKVITGEATPIYLFDPRVPAMVKRDLPDVKLIVLLRDPAERAVSHYWMSVEKGRELLSPEDAFAAEGERIQPDLRRIAEGRPPGDAFRHQSYVSRGLYADQLERWLSLFERQQMLILDFDDLVEKPQIVYEKTLRFLDVDPDVAPPPEFRAVNVGRKDMPDPETMAWLRDQYAVPNERLRNLVGVAFDAPK